ncbi:MAG TPA: CoA transferase [Thermoanaerobaculia bacterium]|jgi:formyl-CoA transferase/CoA:oxalate CoA-transferase|nr:CoA transferase [Thermoanaerobaculia bacterium]
MPRRRGPLAGLRVIDASRVLAGPYLAMLLGDLGADVVKIERPGSGDQTRAWGPPWVGQDTARVSAYFVSANRNKRSVALDLKRPAARAAFERLLAGADVLVENFLPAEWRRLGFRRSRFHRVYHRLVQCTVTSYGTAGPEADRPAYDVVLQAESGLMSLTGFADGEPVRVGVAIVDILSALYGLSAVLAALRRRDATGRGSHVEVSMVDAGAAFLSYATQSWLADGRQPARLGSAHPNLAPYQAFRAADGWFVVGVGSQDLWRRICAALGRPELADDPRFQDNEARVRNRHELDALLGEVFAGRPIAHWDAAMRAHRVPAGPPATVGEAVGKARARGQVVDLPAGAYGILPTLAAPFLFDGRRANPVASVPALGEHTVEVLKAAGMSGKEIRDLQSPAKFP